MHTIFPSKAITLGAFTILLLAREATPTRAAEGVSANVPPEASHLGVNLAVGEFGKTPGVFNKDYTYPGMKDFAHFQSKGLGLARIPFKWERVQPRLMAPLDPTELRRLDAMVAAAEAAGAKLLLDVHNYARYRGQVIGTEDVPNAAFADLWRRLALHFRDSDTVFAYGIMNEPHGTGGRWPAAAQAAVDAIRSVDSRHTISVCGDGWSGAHSWKRINAGLALTDPAQNLVYEAHQYFDHDHSGTYKRRYDEAKAHPDIGVERLRPFVEWLREHKAQGFIGEFGVPAGDPRWLEVLDRFIAAMKRHNLGGTYWAAGPWWGGYPLSVQPTGDGDRPQMEVLALYAGDRTKPADARTSYADAHDRMGNAPRLPNANGQTGRAGREKTAYDFRVRAESYHYQNEGSEFSSAPVSDGPRFARRIGFRHVGNPSWIGMGIYFGGLKCDGRTAFNLDLRADRPCDLEVKVFAVGGGKYTGRFKVPADWRRLDIPFAALRGPDGAFPSGKAVYLGEFRLATGEED
jgi:endoglucanase